TGGGGREAKPWHGRETVPQQAPDHEQVPPGPEPPMVSRCYHTWSSSTRAKAARRSTPLCKPKEWFCACVAPGKVGKVGKTLGRDAAVGTPLAMENFSTLPPGAPCERGSRDQSNGGLLESF